MSRQRSSSCRFALVAVGVMLALVGRAAAQTDEPTALGAALAIEQTVVEAIARAEKSVVAIARVRVDGGAPRPLRLAPDEPALLPAHRRLDPTHPEFVPNEYATGVVIDAAGLILTNYHVLGDPAQCEYYVWLDKRPFKARVKAEDPWLDLAVLEIEAADLTPIVLGDADQLRKGQFVIALGNPFAIARDGEPCAATGVISNLARPMPPASGSAETERQRPSLHHYGTLIYTDVRLQLGSSGGALLNLRGEMVGLTTALAALPGGEQAGGYALPVNAAFHRAVEALRRGQRVDYGFLGVAPEHLLTGDRRAGRRGAKVEQVVGGTPAARSDLRRGDVVTRVNQTAVVDATDLIRQLSQLPAGADVELTIERGDLGRSTTLPRRVTLAKKHIDAPRPIITAEPPRAWRGLQVDYATAIPNFHTRFDAVDPTGCVAIVAVERDSPAWKADLRPRMFISHVGRLQVGTPDEFFAAVAATTGPVRLRLTERIGTSPERTVAP